MKKIPKKIHRLKTWHGPFQAVKHGLKPFEIRKDDRDFREGDFLVLDEWNPLLKEYTAERPIVRLVGYTLDGGFGLMPGHVAMAVDKLADARVAEMIVDLAPPRDDASPDQSKGEP